MVRYVLIEMVWRLVRWQPDYRPLQKLRRTPSKRGKRRPVVAAARRLDINWGSITFTFRAGNVSKKTVTERFTPKNTGVNLLEFYCPESGLSLKDLRPSDPRAFLLDPQPRFLPRGEKTRYNRP